MASVQSIKYKVNKDFISNYDEILNCQLINQYMDTGMIDNDKLTIAPRSNTILAGLTNYTGRKSEIFFHTDKTGTTRAYSIFSNTTNFTRNYSIYYTDISSNGILGNWNLLITGGVYTGLTPQYPKFYFATVTAPVMNSGSVFPCTTVNISTTVDRVKRNMTTDQDVNTGNRSGANAIGKILQVISEENYTGVYAYVSGYDSTTDEYIIEGSGALIPFKNSMLYGIYDRVAPVLRISSEYFLEYYFDGLTNDGYLRGLATYSLRKTSFIGSSEFFKESLLFNNSQCTYKGGTLIFTKGIIGNPFFYTLTSGFTVTPKKITGLYLYKNRIIAYGTDFICAYSLGGKIEILSDTIGVLNNAIFSTGDDLYIISNKNKIVSINELSSGTLFIKNITQQLSNYTKTFEEDCFIGADSRNIYFGGNTRNSGAYVNFTYLLVYSLEYKFWSVYSIPTVYAISSYNNIVYFASRYASTHIQFSQDTYSGMDWIYTSDIREYYYNGVNQTSVATATEIPFLQKISTRWNDLGDIFTLKQPFRILLGLDNVRNNIAVTQFMVLDEKLSSTAKKTFSLTQIASSSVLGLGVTGAEIVGGSNVASNTLVPRIKTVKFIKNPCNSTKIVLESVGTKPFFLNNMVHEIEINPSTNDYQNPNSTN